ncbi:MAG: hypothetical protein IKO05_11855 [Selenomonadaceae bacterium]|nr:hypothetical protein [Selenomonadaceae bacterium]
MEPITINCEGLSKKRIVELADDLCPLYRTVIIAGEKISLDKPTREDSNVALTFIVAQYFADERCSP